MRRKTRHWLLGSAIAIPFMLTLAGCTESNSTNPKKSEVTVKPAELKPVTLKLLAGDSYLPDVDLQILLVEPLKKKYPHITLEMIRPVKGSTIQELVVANAIPDLFILGYGSKKDYKDLGLLTDLRPSMKKLQMDLTRFQPGVIEYFGDNGEVYGLPYAKNMNVTYYNKDLFNRFGVEYPKDGMLWDDALSLARKMTRLVDGVQYRGFDYNSLMRPSLALSLNVLDAKGKITIDTASWRSVLTLAKSFDDISGNRLQKSYLTDFMDTRITAMVGTVNLLSRLNVPAYQDLEWDMAQYPSFPEKPNTFTHADTHVIAAAKTSQHLEDAIRVMEVMTSDEVQLISARKTARVSPINGQQFQEQFGADMQFVKGKRTAAIFKSKYASLPTHPTEFDSKVKDILNTNYVKYRDGTIDLNTYLRISEEEAAKYIQSAGQ